MFYLLLECGKNFENYLHHLASKDQQADFREISAKYTTDVIGSCAFGLNTNSLVDEDSLFRRMGKKIFTPNLRLMVMMKMRDLSPTLYNLLGPYIANRDVNEFFIQSIRDTMDYRKTNNIVRHDFIDVLLDLKEHPEKLQGIGN